jgi:hypothetical protein
MTKRGCLGERRVGIIARDRVRSRVLEGRTGRGWGLRVLLGLDQEEGSEGLARKVHFGVWQEG